MVDKNRSSNHSKVSPDDLDRRAPLPRVASLKTRPLTVTVDDLSDQEFLALSTEVQWTARFAYNSLIRKDIMHLLLLCNYEALKYGVGFWLYMAMKLCIDSLIGSKSNALEIRDEKERTACAVALLILRDLEQENWTYGGRVQVSDHTQQILLHTEGLVITIRQYGSIKSARNLKKFITVRAEPLESSILKRQENSQRYESYCKGYGESSGFALRKMRTRQSTELDGETEDRPLKFSLKNLPKYFQLNLIDLLSGRKKKGIL